MTRRLIMRGAEPFLLPGNEDGCLLIHGFTGTPNEMRGLGETLSEQGYTALGVRLAGHTTSPEDMARMRWWDWLASVEDGYAYLSKISRRIFVMGLSMGGVLALIFASRFPVAGVVAMATPFQLPKDPRLPYARLIALFRPYRPKSVPKWYDKEAAKLHLSYTVDPVLGYVQLRYLLAEMRTSLPRVNVPVLLIYSQNDPTVTLADGHMEAIYANLGSTHKEKYIVEHSGHIVTNDQAREEVRDRILNFVATVVETAQ